MNTQQSTPLWKIPPWLLEPPARERFHWEIEFDQLEADEVVRAQIRRGEDPETSTNDTIQWGESTDPKGWITLEEALGYIRAIKDHPEVWESYKPQYYHRDPDAEIDLINFEISDEERAHTNWRNKFEHWYRLKFLPEAHPAAFVDPRIIVRDHLRGKIDDPFGATARSIMLEDGSMIVEKRS
ncbi:hypothetical protein [Hoeflea prorocentri]|uniref:Uncharacterized protein n=1 Tax=Hoeflea prorocentri TaxID=1922333 RepID=A0A9X3UL71_9HYPH|nr:hypothetical protein [Hoeflea prorocentri]MCY6381006.1 hypothetical protein [Hoeflea prorocentri]MDA5398806.1 hypothetical protein [Hoeflea prorocentri]